MISALLSNNILSDFWYIQATTIGIIVSMTSNFLLNKIWTFEDNDFSIKKTMRQYGSFAAVSSLGATLQLISLFLFVDLYEMPYTVSLLLAVSVASSSNFILNKKLTFGEKILE
jgi:dolichol-phosphate mannosyltransferase